MAGKSSKNYWRKREETARAANIKSEEQYAKEIQNIYATMIDEITKEINGFYAKYAKKEGITMAEARKRATKLDIKAYERKAKKYVKEKNFSSKTNAEMRLYNLTMKVNRLELLKANIGLEMVSGFDELQKFYEEKLTEQTLKEFERQAGILGKTVLNNQQAAHAIVNASFKNATYSDRIWMYQSMLKAELSALLQTGLIQGKHSTVLAQHLVKRFGVSRYNAIRLMVTEMARVRTEAQKQSFERNGFAEYQFNAVGSGACSICAALDEKHFQVKDMMPGENAPPMHPNCRCSISAYVDQETYREWLDSYKEHGLGYREWLKGKNTNKVKIDAMSLQLPKSASKISGMSRQDRTEIETAIKNIQKEYDIRLDAIETASLGKGIIFSAAPYIDQGTMKFALVLNEDIDYTKVKKNISVRYQNGRFAGRSIEDYIAHEMAHIMTYQDCATESDYKTKKRIIQKQFVSGISGYADKTQDGAESLAEAFVRFKNGEKLPVKAEILVRTYIERWKK